MLRLILTRLAFGLFLLWAISLIVFLATEALPGNPARAILGPTASHQQIIALTKRLDLDRPLVPQYLHWLGGVVHLNFGRSLATGASVSSILGPRILNSLVLMAIATVISTPIAVGLGVWSARRRDRVIDHVVAIGSLIFAALPEFVVGIILIVCFSTGLLHLFPAVYVATGSGHAWAHPSQLVLPVTALCILVVPYISRMTRATTIEILESDFVELARLKGLPERTVLTRHALPNVIGPIAQVIALEMAYLAGGIVVIEFLFNYPGFGGQLVTAVSNRDVPTIQALTLFIAAVYILVNLLADVVSLAANPRVRTGRK
jgi:peptide/nickel transport system permease protein